MKALKLKFSIKVTVMLIMAEKRILHTSQIPYVGRQFFITDCLAHTRAADFVIFPKNPNQTCFKNDF